MANPIEEAFAPLREALKPEGALPLTVLRLNPGCAVQAYLPQAAIDEIIKFQMIGNALGESESACMQLAKIVLMDSAYMTK